MRANILKGYLFLVGFITAIASVIIGSIIVKYDPNNLDVKIYILFFGSLFIGLTGLATLIGSQIRISVNKSYLISYLITSLRQGFLISLALIGILLLRITNVLNWWDGILLVSAILLLEFYFRTSK